MKVTKLLIITILLLFPFGEILRFDIGNNIGIKPIDVMVGMVAIFWVLLLVKNGGRKFMTRVFSRKDKNIFLPFIAFVAIGMLSLFINLLWLKSSEFFVSSLYLLRWASYATLFFIVVQMDQRFKNKIKLLLIIDGLVILVLGYLQYFFFNSLKSLYYLGWDEHMHRMFSSFFDPNFAGAFFVLYSIFIGGILNKNKVLNTKYKVLLWMTLVFTFVAILLTFSRSAIIMLIVSFVMFLFLINRKRLIFVLLLIILLFGIGISPKSYDENMNLFREASSKARFENISTAIMIIRDHPVFGVGFNSYRYTKNLYGLNHDWVNAPSHADAGVDNSFLFVLATTGIAGGIAYAGIWITVLKHALNKYKNKKNFLVAVTISSILGIFVNSLFINSLFFAPFMLWLWILIGLMWSD